MLSKRCCPPHLWDSRYRTSVRHRTGGLALTLCLAVLSSVRVAGADDKDASHHYLHKTEKPHAAEWGYTGPTGPAYWGTLSPAYALAKTGRRQSPVDLHSATSKKLPSLNLQYRPSKIHLIYNGHTIQENEDPGSCELLNGVRYELQQFHFHSPSEHTVDGRHFPMEMHLVHQSQDGRVAVVGVLIEIGAHNHAFDDLWSMLPDDRQPGRDSEKSIDVGRLLPRELAYYSYEGSFTTPPCTEDVQWAVLKQPIVLSAAQVEAFRAVIQGNNRPVQPLHGRVLYESAP